MLSIFPVIFLVIWNFATAKARYDEMVETIVAEEAQSEKLSNFVKVLKAQDDTVREFGSMVKFVTDGKDKKIAVSFRDDTETTA